MNNDTKVFISYFHDSQTHEDWVKQLSTELRSKGIDAVLDQWELKIGDEPAVFSMLEFPDQIGFRLFAQKTMPANMMRTKVASVMGIDPIYIKLS